MRKSKPNKSKPKMPRYCLHQPSGRAYVWLGRRIYLGQYGTPESRNEYDRRVKEYLAGKVAEATHPTDTPDRVPGYYYHQPTNQAYVRIDGHDVYLGEYDSPESRTKYQQVIAEWLANGRILPAKYCPVAAKLLVVGVAEYVKKIEYDYRFIGRSFEPDVVRSTMVPLVELYGNTPIELFGPPELRAVQERMIQKGWKRRSINKKINRVRQMFRWFVSQNYITAAAADALKTVEPLKKRKCAAIEGKRVKPVDPVHIEAVWEFLGRQIQAMILVQEYTAARPGEVQIMRKCDIDMTDPACWIYRPAYHKTDYIDRDSEEEEERLIYLGPNAQEAIKSFLDRPDDAYLFSPKEAVAEMRAKRRANRKTPLYPSQMKRLEKQAKAHPQRTVGDRYNKDSYRITIRRACDKADLEAHKKHPEIPWDGKEMRIVPRWHPNQLRHLAATVIRHQFGLEAAQAMLGHRNIAITQVYAEANRKKAKKAAETIG